MPLRNLTEAERKSTVALLAAIERKDRRFRLFQTAFMICTFLLLIILIFNQSDTLEEIQTQNAVERTADQRQSKESNERQETVIRRLDCLALFFSETNRTGLSIKNIDKCVLDRNGIYEQLTTPPSAQGNSAASASSGEVPRQAPATSAPPATDVNNNSGVVVTPPLANEEETDERTPLGKLPFIGGILNRLGL